jgi:hypothetical protein
MSRYGSTGTEQLFANYAHLFLRFWELDEESNHIARVTLCARSEFLSETAISVLHLIDLYFLNLYSLLL